MNSLKIILITLVGIIGFSSNKYFVENKPKDYFTCPTGISPIHFCPNTSVNWTYYAPSGWRLDWMGPVNPALCDHTMAFTEVTSGGGLSGINISGTANPAGESCKYTYKLTNNSTGEVCTYLVGIHVDTSCP